MPFSPAYHNAYHCTYTVLFMLQAMKAHAQKKFASQATKQGVIDIHAQEGQALTSSLSGTLLAISLSLSLLAAIVDASGCQLLFLKGLLQSFCIGNVYAPQWQLMPFLKLLHLCCTLPCCVVLYCLVLQHTLPDITSSITHASVIYSNVIQRKLSQVHR